MTHSGPTLKDLTIESFQVLIPLLLDDPLWDICAVDGAKTQKIRLNPSFAG